jgi:hypothetical protein
VRLRQNLPARGALLLAVSLVTASLFAVASAVGGGGSDFARFRYAGVVENGRGAPAHQIASGDVFRLVFFDVLSQGRRSERYRVCLGAAGKSNIRCWNRMARYGLSRFALSRALLPQVPLGGPVTARWLIGGRVVAAWSFLYVRGVF